MPKILIKLQNGPDQRWVSEVEAKIRGERFAVHLPLNLETNEQFYGYWVVVHLGTGAALAYAKTLQDARRIHKRCESFVSPNWWSSDEQTIKNSESALAEADSLRTLGATISPPNFNYKKMNSKTNKIKRGARGSFLDSRTNRTIKSQYVRPFPATEGCEVVLLEPWDGKKTGDRAIIQQSQFREEVKS